MAIQFSNQVLESMGFTKISEKMKIVARFCSLHVYEIRGITLQERSLPSRTDSVQQRKFRMAIGSSVNQICQELIGDEFTDDEDSWQTEHKCKPPYLVVQFGPTAEHSFSGSRFQDRGDSLCTYEGFSQAKNELRDWSNEIIPHLMTGLVASFFDQECGIKFLPVDRTVYGITPEGRTVHDIRFSASATLSTSRAMTAAIATNNIENALEIARNSKPKVVKFFHLANEEEDSLKRFLYFFLAIEIETHKTFEQIDHSQNISILFPPQARVSVSTQKFFESQAENWKNLRDRFMWCVLCAWPQLTDVDVEEFKKLKQVRDSIAHGTIETPPMSAVQSVEKLAVKLFKSVVV